MSYKDSYQLTRHGFLIVCVGLPCIKNNLLAELKGPIGLDFRRQSKGKFWFILLWGGVSVSNHAYVDDDAAAAAYIYKRQASVAQIKYVNWGLFIYDGAVQKGRLIQEVLRAF